MLGMAKNPHTDKIHHAIKIAKNNAPYLKESLSLFPEIVEALSQQTSENLIASLFAALPARPEALTLEMTALRALKRKVHLIVALTDIAKIWSWVEVTEYLSQLADLCMDRLLYSVAVDAGLTLGENTPVPGLFILAVGKYGARELNYSSDIDFNVFYDPEILQLPDMNRVERTLIRLIQKFIKAFEQDNGAGYIFRTDLRLRPDPRSNAIVVSTHTAERYYEVLGQNWERAAMIKARVCAGDFAVGNDFIQSVLTPFIWRRNLDYAAIEDIHSIKRQMQAVKGLETLNVAGHNLKLGLGGIREIEFFCQVQQLILGGRHPELRTLRTVEALQALSEGQFVSPKTTEILVQSYSALRGYEHYAQMREDKQTHLAPLDDTERLELARLAGFSKLSEFDQSLRTCLITVHDIYNALFPEAETLSSDIGSLVFTGVEPDPSTLETLSGLGFSNPLSVWQDMSDWLGGRINATRSERARELLTALAPKILKLCSETGASDEAFRAFASFFTEIKSARTLLTMFSRHPDRLHHIISLMLASPRIRETISDKPQILDVMSEPHFLEFDDIVPSLSSLEKDNNPLDFEDSLDAVRREVREDHFRICAATLSAHLDVGSVPTLLSDIADQAVKKLMPISAQEVIRLFGSLDGDYAVLGLGKLGGRELSLSSDLDIMLIYQPRSRETKVVNFARFTQKLISALSVQTAEGRLYEVDMALRPSGRAGPVAVSLPSFENYYASAAWTWEYMALTRARIIAASSSDFADRLAESVSTALSALRPDLDFKVDILDMRKRTAKEKTARSKWDVKEMPGGLRDIEYIAQSVLLACRNTASISKMTSSQNMLDYGLKHEQLSLGAHKVLTNALGFYANVLTISAMISSKPLSQFGEKSVARLAQNLKLESTEALEKRRDEHYNEVAALVADLLGPVYMP